MRQLVDLKQEITKHTARQLYIVTSDIKDNLVLIKKILHFHSDKPGKFLNIEHTVQQSELISVTSKPKKVHKDINTWQEIKKIMNPRTKRKTKSLSLKEIQNITYTYDTSEDESEEKNKEEIDNTPNAETVANNELEDPAPYLDVANIPDTSVELGNNTPDLTLLGLFLIKILMGGGFYKPIGGQLLTEEGPVFENKCPSNKVFSAMSLSSSTSGPPSTTKLKKLSSSRSFLGSD